MLKTLNTRLQFLLQYTALIIVLVLLVLGFSLGSKNFFTPATLISIANQIPDLTLVTIGMTMVLIIGGIDLGVGSVMALSSAILCVLCVTWHWPLAVAIPVSLIVASLCGWFNGLISIGCGIPSFIVTLGMLEIARGATKLVTDSQTIYIGSRIEWLGEPLPRIFLSPACLMSLALVLLFQFILQRTVYGRYLIAIGTNVETVRMSGIRTGFYSISVFVISGLMCGLAGLIQTSRLSSADPNGAMGIELSAIAACVIGGTSLQGGRGTIIGAFLGVLIISVLQSGLAQMGVSDALKQIITGSVIVIAVLQDALKTRWKSD